MSAETTVALKLKENWERLRDVHWNFEDFEKVFVHEEYETVLCKEPDEFPLLPSEPRLFFYKETQPILTIEGIIYINTIVGSSLEYPKLKVVLERWISKNK